MYITITKREMRKNGPMFRRVGVFLAVLQLIQHILYNNGACMSNVKDNFGLFPDNR